MSMVMTIIGVIVVLAGILGVGLIAKENPWWKRSVFGIVAGVIITLVAQSVVIIPTNCTGVRTTFGQISERTLNNGLNFKIPFIQTIAKVDNKLQDLLTCKDTLSCETINQTEVFYSDVIVTYQINSEKSAWIYTNISNYKSNLISEDIVSSAVKSVSKASNDQDATNRDIIEPLVATSIQNSINQKYGENIVAIRKVVVKNADFGQAYNQAIAERQNAQIAYEKQQIENKKLVETKEAEAEAKVKEAEGEAKANEILKASISSEVLQSKMLDKWNGELPKAVGGNNGFLLDLFNKGTNTEQ